jgi:acetate kinase
VPYEWYEKYGIRRLGFHGSSHCYVAQRVPQLLGRPAEGLRVISCHLGGSSSITAIKDGKSVDTSMGFSAQTGLPHSTRCGDIDPFIIPFMMDQERWTTDDIRRKLTKESGLAGISGLSGDVRDLEEAAAAGNERAQLALDVFIHACRKYVGAYIAVLGGIDALAFAGGIGENGAEVRKRICEDLEFLGIVLDDAKNTLGSKEGDISKDGSPVRVLVVPTNEEIIVAREAVKVVESL